MPLGPGSLAGPYEILSTLGSGGMGTVYLARDRRLDRHVALKVLHGAPDAEARLRLLREARAASALNHPHICRVYDVGEQDSAAWIAMEYVEGQRLDARIPPGGLHRDEALRIAIQLADGLAHAHERGIVHRDLKSANVVCDAEGRARILDFGIASRLPHKLAEELTRSQAAADTTGEVAGTIPYMAPEVLKGDRADQRSDLWSLGVLLHEMLSGALPFRGTTPFATASAILESPPAPLPAAVPEGVAAVVARLLSKNPADRYRSAREARAAFEALHTGTLVPVGRRRGRGLWWAAVATVLLAAAAWWAVSRLNAPAGLSLSEQRLLSVGGRSERSPTLSPDGSMLAFVAPDAAGVSQIWVRNLSGDGAIQLTSAEQPASRPRWSPAGDQIVYALAGQGIWSVPPLGGEPRRLLESGANPNVSRDGARLVFEHGRGIWTAAADGADPREVDGVQPRYYTIPMGPAFSPDGQYIAYFLPERGPNGDFWVVPSAGGTPRRLTDDLREGGWPVWTGDGRFIVFSSARAGSRTLWQIPADGGEPRPLTAGAGEDDEPDLASDGRSLVYSNVRNNWELRVRNLADASERTLLERRGELLFPLFSPDGRQLTFFGRSNYAVAIWTIAADGSGLRQLTGGRELNHQPRWGSDGAHIYFFQVAPTISFRRVPAVGGASTAFRDWEWQTVNAPYFDPTGRYIAYTRNRPLDAPPDTPEALVIHEVASGLERLLPGEHGHMGRWSPDGRELVAWRHDGHVWICQVESGACRQLAEGHAPVWSGDGQRVYVLRAPRGWQNPLGVWSIQRDGTGARFEASLGLTMDR
jgi:eukaryotic-like serine/threonine-protein kinase